MSTFTVYGTPRPQGSMRAFWRPGMKHAAITSDNKQLKPWRQQLTATAMSLGVEPFGQHAPVSVALAFYFTRPKSAKKRVGMTVKPDVDKLIRACFDSIKGVLIHDDAQVTRITATKHYGDPERVDITITPAI